MPIKKIYSASLRRPFLYIALPALLLAGGWYFLGRTPATDEELMVAHRTSFVDSIRVSGSVVAAQEVDLGFTQSGRIASVSTRVGQIVGAGSVLASIDNGDLRANVAQKRAALAQQEAKLSAIQNGTRPEELALKISAVTSATTALQNTLSDGYRSADDAVHNKTTALFVNASSQPQLVFSTSNSQLRIRIESERKDLESALSAARTNADQGVIRALLASVSTYLADLSSALADASANQNFSQADIDNAIAAVGSARGTVNTSISAIASAAATLDNAEIDLALAQAGAVSTDVEAQAALVAAAKADVESAEAQLQKTLIIAPFFGTVTKVDAKVGQLVSPGVSEISMISNGAFQVESYIPEVAIAKVLVGNSATVTLDAYGPATYFDAKVVGIDLARTLRDGVSTYKTVLQFSKKDARIRSGMTADVEVKTQEKPDVISIPKAAVYTRGGQSYVRVSDGKSSTERNVTTGLQSLGSIEITSGLQDGESVVLNPRQ